MTGGGSLLAHIIGHAHAAGRPLEATSARPRLPPRVTCTVASSAMGLPSRRRPPCSLMPPIPSLDALQPCQSNPVPPACPSIAEQMELARLAGEGRAIQAPPPIKGGWRERMHVVLRSEGIHETDVMVQMQPTHVPTQAPVQGAR